ncbi:MAG: EamA family transporter [Candidatus Lokiarchaeota archaeon]|nr:EamA family transporter [Candidatus Lokiarchaeota archaeon]
MKLQVRKEDITGYLTIIIAVFTFSCSEIIIKLLQDSIGALSLSFYRFLFSGFFLLLLLTIMKDLRGIWSIIKKNWLLLILGSSLAWGISNIIYFIGIQNTQANIGATIYTTYPIWITIYSFFFLNEKINMKFKIAGIIVGLLGVTILLTNFNFSELIKIENLLGNLLVLIGSITWGFYSVLGKKVQLKESKTTNIALKFTMISSFFAMVPVFVILIFTPELGRLFAHDAREWSLVLFLGVISTGLGLFLLFIGLKRLEVSRGMSLAFLKPIFATVLAFFLLNETPTIVLLISVCMVVISILLINKNNKQNNIN